MAFEHTIRSLGSMRLKRHAVLTLLLVTTFGAWLTWLIGGHVAIYVRSASARLEVKQSAFPVQSPVGGIVTECALGLGRHVEVGDLLVQLDVKPLELQLGEERAIARGSDVAVGALRAQLEVEKRAHEAVSRLVGSTRLVGTARVSADEKSMEFKLAELRMIEKLRAESLASGLESLRTESEHEAGRKQLALTRQQAKLDTMSALTAVSVSEARVSGLQKLVSDAEAKAQLDQAKLETLSYEVERRSIRARVAGTLSDVVSCTPGMTIESSTRLATLLPDGQVRVVAYFAAREAIGRLERSQDALVRVDNYPWTQFGVLRAAVREIGSEARDGLVRVELELAGSNDAIPVIHGLVGTVEVHTETLAPGRLLMRLAGQPWSQPAVAHSPGPGPGAAGANPSGPAL